MSPTEEREVLLQPYLKRKGWLGGWRTFENVPLDVLEELIDKGFLEPNRRQNDSPTVQNFMDFMKKWQEQGVEILAHGYEISEERKDTRIAIEGLQMNDEPNVPGFASEWMQFNNGADDLGSIWSWWD